MRSRSRYEILLRVPSIEHVKFMQRLSNLCESVDALSAKYGKHTLVLAAGLPVHLHVQHAGNRGELPEW